MFCFKCGKEIKDNIKFCPYCGQIQIVKSNDIFIDNKDINIPYNTKKKNKKRSLPLFIGIFALVLVLILSISICLLLYFKNNNSSVNESKSIISQDEQIDLKKESLNESENKVYEKTEPPKDISNESEQENNEKTEEQQQIIEQNIQIDKKNNEYMANNMSEIRQQVQTELQQVEKKSKNIEEKLYQANTDAESNKYSEQLFELWDDYINVLWGYIKNNIPESEFNTLKQEQIDWIINKEDAIDIAGANGGNLETYFRNLEAINWTKGRIYELINYLP